MLKEQYEKEYNHHLAKINKIQEEEVSYFCFQIYLNIESKRRGTKKARNRESRPSGTCPCCFYGSNAEST